MGDRRMGLIQKERIQRTDQKTKKEPTLYQITVTT